jgi:hypothetical protein
MLSRIRRGEASGPAEWLLAFLRARDVPPRARLGVGVGPADWLLVFLDAVSSGIVRWSDGGGERASQQTEAESEAIYYAAPGA